MQVVAEVGEGFEFDGLELRLVDAVGGVGDGGVGAGGVGAQAAAGCGMVQALGLAEGEYGGLGWRGEL